MLHKPPCRQIEKQADVRCLSSSGYIKDGKAKCPGRKFTILIVLTYQRCMLTAGIFPLTVFCKNGDITNPELSGGKMPDAGRNMTDPCARTDTLTPSSYCCH
ncbi:hypothetical protein BANRA_04675 [Escherichia coli]|nr:hypothetical protein BANRA_04675 [Escherichia coli]